MLASGTQDRGFAPDQSRRIFAAGKIYSMPSFGRGSKIICPMLVTRTTKGQKGQKGQLWYKKKRFDSRFSDGFFFLEGEYSNGDHGLGNLV
jgi:hypothetical protein